MSRVRAALPFAEVHALRARVVELQQGRYGADIIRGADEILEGLSSAQPGDRYHHVYWWRPGQQFAAREFVVRLRAGSLRTLGVLESPDQNQWLRLRCTLQDAAPSMWGDSIKHDRPLPRARYRKIATATAGGVPSALRLKPRSRLKFACESPANETGAAS